MNKLQNTEIHLMMTKTNSKHIVTFLYIGFLFLIASCASKKAEPREPLEDFGSKVDSSFTFDKDRMTTFLKYLHDNNQWQGGVAIMHNEKMMYMKNFGNLEEGSGRRADPGTKYRIGSITKMYTAAIINDLVARGKLSMGSKLSRFYPEIPNAEEINIDEMLGHRTGIYNYTDDKDFDFQADYTDEEIIQRIASYDPVSKPGKEAKYSNSNYFLLGKIIEKVTGYTYEDQLNKSIVAPRQFLRTSYSKPIEPRKNEAYSFYFDQDEKVWKKTPPWQISVAGAAGAISASAADVTRFVSDLYNAHLFTEKYVATFTKIEDDNFGYGAFKFPFEEKTAYGHTGGLESFQSITGYFPEEKIAFTLLSNGLNELSNNDIAIGILSILFDRDYVFPEFGGSKPVENTGSYLGTYFNESLNMEIEITQKDDRLFAQATNQAKFPLTEEQDGVFTYNTAGIKITFKEFNGNQYEVLHLNQSGGEYDFQRQE